jgi:hypothetical protein
LRNPGCGVNFPPALKLEFNRWRPAGPLQKSTGCISEEMQPGLLL